MAHGGGTGKGQSKDHHLPLKNINSSCLSFALRNIKVRTISEKFKRHVTSFTRVYHRMFFLLRAWNNPNTSEDLFGQNLEVTAFSISFPYPSCNHLHQQNVTQADSLLPAVSNAKLISHKQQGATQTSAILSILTDIKS